MRKFWTPSEVLALGQAYAQPTFEEAQLSELAIRLGRSKIAVHLKASELGLTDRGKRKVVARKDEPKFKSRQERSAYQSRVSKERIARNGHPRGMAGKRHSAASAEAISRSNKARWAARPEAEKIEIGTKIAKALAGAPQVKRGSWKAGWREIGGRRCFFRSKWEANYARYLEWLKARGEILEWEYEPRTFWFEAIKRGVRSYKPDFLVTEKNGQQAWHEVKGWMDARSKTCLKRMAKYYPSERIILIQEKQYRAIISTVARLVDWE